MPKKTRKNPHGLTGKQLLAAEDIAEKMAKGDPASPVKSHEKIYNVSTKESAKTITSRNMNNPDFRNAIVDRLHERRILGPDGKVELRLEEGLDATDKDENVDYTNRLKYIQEIHKIAGVYAPQKVERKTLNLSLEVSEEELDEKIASLQQELEDK